MNFVNSNKIENRCRKVLSQVENTNRLIKENSNKNQAIMSDIMNYLVEFGWILRDLKKREISINTSDIYERLKSDIMWLLKEKNDYIEDFTETFDIELLWKSFIFKVFTGNYDYYSVYDKNLKKKLLCQEMSVLENIYNRRLDNPDYIYNDTITYRNMLNMASEIMDRDVMPLVFMKIINSNYEPNNDLYGLKFDDKKASR